MADCCCSLSCPWPQALFAYLSLESTKGRVQMDIGKASDKADGAENERPHETRRHLAAAIDAQLLVLLIVPTGIRVERIDLQNLGSACGATKRQAPSYSFACHRTHSMQPPRDRLLSKLRAKIAGIPAVATFSTQENDTHT